MKFMTKENKSSKENAFNFETSLNELEKLVDALEQGDLSLDQSLQDFERGINLTRSCQTALTDARQKVQILLDNNEQSTLADYQSDIEKETDKKIKNDPKAGL